MITLNNVWWSCYIIPIFYAWCLTIKGECSLETAETGTGTGTNLCWIFLVQCLMFCLFNVYLSNAPGSKGCLHCLSVSVASHGKQAETWKVWIGRGKIQDKSKPLLSRSAGDSRGQICFDKTFGSISCRIGHLLSSALPQCPQIQRQTQIQTQMQIQTPKHIFNGVINTCKSKSCR